MIESETTETTAENYFLNGRYNRNITDSFFWYTGAGWERNRFAGIDNRYLVEAGAGNIWFDSDEHKFRTTYGVTYTDQEDLVKNPVVDDNFLGARFAWNYLNKFGSNTTYENGLVMDFNVDESDDWRGEMTNSLSVAMSERLALKLGLKLLYDNMPSLVQVPLESPAGTPTGLNRPAELDEMDTIFTASVVVNF